MPSTGETKQFFHTYLDAINGKPKPLGDLQRFISDPVLIQHILEAEAGFPLYEIAVEDLIAEDNTVALRGLFRGLHSGPFAGMPPTGKKVEVPVMLFYRVEGDRITQHWMQMDGQSLMQQLTAAA